MPFINALGYNVFDPSEVVHLNLMLTSVLKRMLIVDYAIIIDDKPVILFECQTLQCNP